MKLIYIVDVGFMEFVFTGGTEALKFAKTAVMARKEYGPVNIRVETQAIWEETNAEYAAMIEPEQMPQEQRDQDYLFTDEV